MENESEVIKMHIILLMCFYSSKLRLGLHFAVDSGCSLSSKKYIVECKMSTVYVCTPSVYILLLLLNYYYNVCN